VILAQQALADAQKALDESRADPKADDDDTACTSNCN